MCINAWLYLQPFAPPFIVNVRPFVTLFLSLFPLFQSFVIPSLEWVFLMLHIVLRIRFAFIRKHNSTNDLTFVRITFSHYLLKLCRFFFTNWKIWTGWTELDDWRNGIELLMPIHWPRLSSYSLNFLDYFLVIFILRW